MGLRQPSFARGHMYGRKSVSNGAASEALEGSRAFPKGPACSTPSLWRPSPHSSYGTVLQDVTCQIPRMAVRCKRNKHEEEQSHHTSQLLCLLIKAWENVWERVAECPEPCGLVSVASRWSSWVSAGMKSFREWLMKRSSILVIKQVFTTIKGLQYLRHFIARASALAGVSHYFKIRAGVLLFS